MGQYLCYDEALLHAVYFPTLSSVLMAQPKPCAMWYDPEIMATVLDTVGKPVNFILAGIVWKPRPNPTAVKDFK